MLQLGLVKDEQEVPVSVSEIVHIWECEVALLSSVVKEEVSLVSSVGKEEVALSSVEAVFISSVRIAPVSLPPQVEDNVFEVCDEEASEMVELFRVGFTPE